jgi:hypothetical protein
MTYLRCGRQRLDSELPRLNSNMVCAVTEMASPVLNARFVDQAGLVTSDGESAYGIPCMTRHPSRPPAGSAK